MPDFSTTPADNVGSYLATNNLGRVGRTIFVNNLPEGRVNVFLISDAPGAKPEQYYPLDHPGVQVAFYAAAHDHAAGWQKIMDAYHLLNRKQNLMIGTMDAMYTQAVASPQSLGLDPKQNRWLFVVNVMFKIRGTDGY